ncbi:MAG: PhoH family protein, partial [Bacillus sp. (in: firmicutes)]
GHPDQLDLAGKVIDKLLEVIKKGIAISQRDVSYAVKLVKKGTIDYFGELYEEEISKNAKGKSIRVKTFGQRRYVSAIKQNDLVFGIGPAGTGKTYLAVVMAVNALKNGQVKRIILTRPAVEAGESLGFLPGDLKEKVDPYLRPLYDALYDVLGQEHTVRQIERGTIEIAPLAYMRGRTLDDAFVILDEAQNTTHAQMKMFLTRLGFGSKMVITGDRTQVDLPKGVKSGLTEAENILKNIKGMSFVYLEATDVVRHPLVAKIIGAYDQSEIVES